jgi:hypothetical protein
LSNRSWSAHVAEKQDFYLKVAAVVRHSQHVANPDLSRSFGRLPVGLNPAKFAGSRRQRSRLEESGRPKPLVHSHRGHDSFSYTNGISGDVSVHMNVHMKQIAQKKSSGQPPPVPGTSNLQPLSRN